MTLRDDVLAVRQNDALSPAEKRAAIYDLKGTAIVDLFTSKVGQIITRGVYTIRLDRVPVLHPNKTLEFWITVTKNGIEQPLDLPILVTNPPIMVPDVTPGAFRLDVLQAIRDVLIDVVR